MRREERARRLGVSVHELPDGRGRHGNHARGPANGKWSTGRLLSSHGYVLVRVGIEHPLAFGNGDAYEHELVAVTALGRAVAPDETVHHKNRDKTDNRWENLKVLTRSEHGREHAPLRRRDRGGRFAGDEAIPEPAA